MVTIHNSIIKMIMKGTMFFLKEVTIKEGSNRHFEKVKKMRNEGNNVEKVEISHIFVVPWPMTVSKSAS